MTEQEKINVETQRQLALQDAKFNAFVEEMRDFKIEMRDRDNQRAAEIMEIRQRQEAAQAKHDTDMKTMQAQFNEKFESMNKHLQTITTTTMVGVGTSVIAVVVLVGTTLYALFMR